ncbi:MAG: hypothetical protein V1871_03180 [Planctomycetota bacterium]
MNEVNHQELKRNKIWRGQWGKPCTLSLIMALFLTVLGLIRYSSDILTDAIPSWYVVLEGTWLCYLARVPSDGTFWGNLSVQYFKLLAVPCGISGLFILYRFLSHDLREAEYRWRMPEIQALYVLGCLFAFTVMELEKATHVFGLIMAGLLPGERAWLNHVIHIVSAFVGWRYMRWLKFLHRTPSPK